MTILACLQAEIKKSVSNFVLDVKRDKKPPKLLAFIVFAEAL